LVKRARSYELKRGEALYRPGDPASEVILVRTGHLRLSVPDEKGGERVVGVVGPWELTGEEGLRDGARRRYGATAGEGTHIVPLPGAATRQALQTTDKTFQAFLLAKEMDVAFGRALRGLRKPGFTRKRLALLVQQLAERLGRSEGRGTRIPIRLTHQLLADLTVINRSTVTTILNDWMYQGALGEEEGSMVILDPGKME
jgi:CRP/FNR family transcriptional regulator